ncbi:hypothetical protein C2E23DRAFT_189570 [Lenzites betulinus]|nr:hypothetical protein C2E23DRAFT_189570 [Lenzites betulinus]
MHCNIRVRTYLGTASYCASLSLYLDSRALLWLGFSHVRSFCNRTNLTRLATIYLFSSRYPSRAFSSLDIRCFWIVRPLRVTCPGVRRAILHDKTLPGHTGGVITPRLRHPPTALERRGRLVRMMDALPVGCNSAPAGMSFGHSHESVHERTLFLRPRAGCARDFVLAKVVATAPVYIMTAVCAMMHVPQGVSYPHRTRLGTLKSTQLCGFPHIARAADEYCISMAEYSFVRRH